MIESRSDPREGDHGPEAAPSPEEDVAVLVEASLELESAAWRLILPG